MPITIPITRGEMPSDLIIDKSAIIVAAAAKIATKIIPLIVPLRFAFENAIFYLFK
jgi:hypothetical protein